MKNIALVTGGYSSEAEVSLRSAAYVKSMFDKTLYNVELIIISGDEWVLEHNGQRFAVNKNDMSVDVENSILLFDAAYILIHGTPGEDGKLQGYFETIRMPYTGCGILASAITFNKFACKTYLRSYNIPTAKAILVRKGDTADPNMIAKELGLPCFVKPNNGGSSYGVSKIKTSGDITAALESAFRHDNEIIIESFIEGTEITCGLLKKGSEIVILPITEVVPESEFFDYEAKYKGKSKEITPARISEKVQTECERLSSTIYEALHCRGIVRIDYIVRNDIPYFIEVNTIPGMTEQSFIPQQIAYMGWPITDFLTCQIEDALSRYR